MTISKLATIRTELEREDRKTSRCKVGEWLETLSEDDKNLAKEIIDTRSFSAQKLVPKFKQVGADFGTTTLRQHRTGMCICSKTLETS